MQALQAAAKLLQTSAPTMCSYRAQLLTQQAEVRLCTRCHSTALPAVPASCWQQSPP
jgi:hypothetical protein